MRDASENRREAERLLAKLIERSREVPIVVEGEKDRRALRAIGVSGEIIKINQGISLMRLAENIAAYHNEVVILTDWDRKGDELAYELSRLFDAVGLKYDLSFRDGLVELVRQEVKDVESLDSYFAKSDEESSELSEYSEGPLAIYLAGDLDNFGESMRANGLPEYAPNDFTSYLSRSIESAMRDLHASIVTGYNPKRGTEQFMLQFSDASKENAGEVVNFAKELRGGLRALSEEKGIKVTISLAITKEPYVNFRAKEGKDGHFTSSGFEKLICWRRLNKLKTRGGDELEVLF